MSQDQDPIIGAIESSLEDIVTKLNELDREKMTDMKKIGFPVLVSEKID